MKREWPFLALEVVLLLVLLRGPQRDQAGRRLPGRIVQFFVNSG